MRRLTIEDVYAELGKRIIDGRKDRNLSQEQLAIESGIDRSHLGFIEQGRRRPTVATLFKISKALNISLERLFRNL